MAKALHDRQNVVLMRQCQILLDQPNSGAHADEQAVVKSLIMQQHTKRGDM